MDCVPNSVSSVISSSTPLCLSSVCLVTFLSNSSTYLICLKTKSGVMAILIFLPTDRHRSISRRIIFLAVKIDLLK